MSEGERRVEVFLYLCLILAILNLAINISFYFNFNQNIIFAPNQTNTENIATIIFSEIFKLFHQSNNRLKPNPI